MCRLTVCVCIIVNNPLRMSLFALIVLPLNPKVNPLFISVLVL